MIMMYEFPVVILCMVEATNNLLDITLLHQFLLIASYKKLGIIIYANNGIVLCLCPVSFDTVITYVVRSLPSN